MDGSTNNSFPCDVCRADENQQSTIADSHCKDCLMNLCKTCCQHHRRSKLTRKHKLVKELADCGCNEANASRSRTCEKHENEDLKIYCSDCREPICPMCYIENHGNHNWLYLKTAAETFRNQILTQVNDLSNCLADTLNKRVLLRQENETAAKRNKELEQEIHSQRDRLKTLIDKQADALLTELRQKQRAIDNDVGSDDVERHLLSLKSFKDNCLSVLKTGTDDKICRLKDHLLSKANAMHSETKTILKAEPQFIRSLHFQPANLDVLDITSTGQLLGIFKDTIKTPGDAIFHGEVPLLGQHLRKVISGITILEQDLYVVCQDSALVGVYATSTLLSLRSFVVHELTDPMDITSCQKNKCLYLIDRNLAKHENFKHENFILRIDLNGNVINKWTKSSAWGWLSVSGEGNVISAYYSNYLASISEFTSNGSLVRDVKLSGAICALHAIKLNSEEFIVSHGSNCDSLQSVRIIDSGGNEKRCFGRMHGWQTNDLKLPVHLSVDMSDHVLVCDSQNGRVLLLDKELRLIKELVTKRDGLENPWRICFDKATGKLFVISKRKRRTRKKIFCFSFN